MIILLPCSLDSELERNVLGLRAGQGSDVILNVLTPNHGHYY